MPLTLLQSPWAADPQEYASIVETLYRGLSDLSALDTLRRPSPPPPAAGTDAALIRVLGPLPRRASWLTEHLGWTSTQDIGDRIRTANADPSIGRIILEIDSPGGSVAGISDLADMIRRSPKPVVAFVDGMAASAAYWLASAAHTLVLSSTAMVGSIGVVMSSRPDPSKPINIISSQSPLKNADPATPDGRAEHQRVVDDLAAIFVSDVAKHRGTTDANVIAKFGRGGLLVGQNAVAVGMADRVGTFEDALRAGPTPRFGASHKAAMDPCARMDAAVADLIRGGMDHSLAVFQAARENPELVAQIARKPLPPDDRNALAAYEAELARLVSAGTPAATAPLELARLNPQLAESGARAALAARTRGFEING